MKFLAVIAVLILFVLLVYGAIKVVSVLRNNFLVANGEWEVKELTSPDGTEYILQLEKPGESDIEIARIFLGTKPYHFQEVLAEKRIEAQDRADTLNRRLT